MERQCLQLKYQKKSLLIFYKIFLSYKMEIQKIINLLKDSNNEKSKFTKKWYVIDSQTAKNKYNPRQFYPI